MNSGERAPLIRSLSERWDELVICYQSHRKRVDRIATSVIALNETVQDFFAAGQAALKMALLDGEILWRQHAKLCRIHTVFHGLTIDQYSECEAGFDAGICHPFDEGGPLHEANEYMELALQTREDLRVRSKETRQYLDLIGSNEDVSGIPYETIVAATLHFAKREDVIDAAELEALGRYFSVFGEVVMHEEYGLGNVARELGQVLGVDMSQLEDTGKYSPKRW